MSRTFAYCRVSTAEQTTANQVLEIKRAGFDVHPRRVIEETISGFTPAALRPMLGFQAGIPEYLVNCIFWASGL